MTWQDAGAGSKLESVARHGTRVFQMKDIFKYIVQAVAVLLCSAENLHDKCRDCFLCHTCLYQVQNGTRIRAV